jgi:hypothetical protein
MSIGRAAACLAVFIFFWTPDGLRAQTGNSQAATATEGASTMPLAGPQIVSVSAYGAYYSHGLPAAGTAAQTGAANLPSDFGLGGSIDFNWSKFTERTTFSLSYTPSYTAQVRYSSLDALNHSASFNISRKLTPLWTLGFTAAVNYTTQQESLFAPAALSTVASVPSSFGQLSGALLAGNFTGNQQLGVALTNSALVQSPLANLLYGQRMLTSSAHGNLSHSFSPRLSVTFSAGGGYSEYVSQNQPLTAAKTAILSNTTSGTASATISYSLSPSSQIGASVVSNWTSSSIEDAVTTTSVATFGHTFGKAWIVQLHGGAGVTNAIRQTAFPIATKPLPAIGGSLGFKTATNTILGSFDHTVADSYGSGASSSNTGTITWRWRRPGSRWSLQGSLSWQQLQGSVLTNTSGWQAGAGANRGFGPHLAMSLQYSYLSYSGGLQAAASRFSESAVRVSMIWTPRSTNLR